MKKNSDEGSCKPDRKTVERNRRIHMKGLCFKLSSIIPLHHPNISKDVLSQQDQIDQAAVYINQLKERIEGLKMRKEVIKRNNGIQLGDGDYNEAATVYDGVYGSKTRPFAPVVDIRERDSGLDVTVISRGNKDFMLYEVVSILKEEGAEVVSASVSKVGDKLFYSVHAQVRICRLGVETARVCERLRGLAGS